VATAAETERRPIVVEESMATRIVRFTSKTPVYLIIAFLGVLWLIPTIGLFFTSVIDPGEIGRIGWWEILSKPSEATFDNYQEIFDNEQITSSIFTTLWVALGGTILPIIVAALAAYAFAWLEFPGRDWLFLVVVGLLVVPLQMALIPIFSLYNSIGDWPLIGSVAGFDTIGSLILFHTAFGLPFAIFLLRNFFIGIPRDLLEAARIDGASELRIFLRLILPLGLPAIASLAIFQFLWVWNDLLVALTFGRDTQVITVAIFSQMRQFSANIELIAPAAFVSLAIPLVVFFAFQRYFVQGLLAGSVK
jgi:alpha-glucoside transport system permease protein